MNSLRRDWLWGAILVLAVVLIYRPAWHAGFIWDDDTLLTHNPCIIGPLGLKEIWTTSEADVCPFVLTTFWVEHALWGLAPEPYHMVSLLLHAASAVVLWQVLRSLQIPGAWIGAALWALHPVQVESVAWIAEMKNTESTLFYLLAIFFFIYWLNAKDSSTTRGRGWSYGLCLLFTALAAASKSSTGILPVVLGLCMWWLEGRWVWRNLVALVTPLLISVVFVTATMATQGTQLATVTATQGARSWPERIATAGDAIWFYLGKLIWPHPLMNVYPRWHVDAYNPVAYLPLLLVILILGLLWWNRDSWCRPWFFACAYFIVTLLPGVGLFDNTIFRYSQVFDHFQYLASMGPLALAGAGLIQLAGILPINGVRVSYGLGASVLLVFGILSWRHARAYENQQTLWSDVLVKDPASWVAYTGLANEMMQTGNLDRAISQYRVSIQLNPEFPEAYNGLAGALQLKGQTNDAIASYRQALQISPGFVVAYNNLGNLLMQQGRIDEALVEYRKALVVYPRYGRAWDNLGNVLMEKGSIDEAISSYRKAVELSPNFASAHDDLGRALLQKNQLEQATTEFQKAVELDPRMERPHTSLGVILSRKGDVDTAIAEFETALQLNPQSVEAGKNLGDALVQKGRIDEAILAYKNVLQLDPHSADAHNNLGNALLEKRQPEQALAEYREALQLNPADAMTHHNAGAALYQMGRWDEAITEFQQVIALIPPNDIPHYDLGLAYARKGETAKAIAEYQKALAINPNNPAARSKLDAAVAQKPPAKKK